MLKVCGENNYNHLGSTSNNAFNFFRIINPAVESTLEASKIISYSANLNHSVVITNDKLAMGAGDNKNNLISPSLPNSPISEFMKFEIKDEEGRLWLPISAFCGRQYTLLLVSPIGQDDNMNHLIYMHSEMYRKYPLFLSTGSSNPVAIYGGNFNAAAIDDNGSIIFIGKSTYENINKPLKIMNLPNEKNAVNVACCNEFIVALSSDFHVYEAAVNSLAFKEVEELKDMKIVDISGTNNHCLALSEDGRVFGRGLNFHGQLGVGNSIGKAEKFIEIESLKNCDIKAVYAGGNHSLFQSSSGKILSCGNNQCGQLIGESLMNEFSFSIIETAITEGATFCVAGSEFSAVFIGCDPSNCPNRKINEELLAKEKSSNLKDALLKSEMENERLRIENEILRKKLSLYKLNDVELYTQNEIDQLEHFKTINCDSQSNLIQVIKKQNYCLKIFETKSTPEKLKEYFSNLQKLNFLNNRNIVKTIGFCFGDTNNSPSVVHSIFPFTLKNDVKKLTKIQRVTSIFEIARAMTDVEKSGLIHSNLKPENILYDDLMHLYLTDFCTGRLIGIEKLKEKSIEFLAPELLKEKSSFDIKSDVYAFGIITFFILTGGQLPAVDFIKSGQIPTEINNVSKELFFKCISENADERPSFLEITNFIHNSNFMLIDEINEDISKIKSFLDQ